MKNVFSKDPYLFFRAFHPSILGDFQFPKKVLLGNFKAEVISERTDAFHKFLNLIANCDNLVSTSQSNSNLSIQFIVNIKKAFMGVFFSKQLYSDHFYSFLSSVEHNEAVSHIKLSR